MFVPVTYQSFRTAVRTIQLAVPDEAAMMQAYTSGTAPAFPFWARCWPSARALAGFLEQQPEYIRGKRVLELAAGLGLPSLVAAGYALQVTASDQAPEAVDMIRLSVQRSGISNLTACVIDWNDPVQLTETDVLLLSDVNYAERDFDRLYAIMRECMDKRITVILATPQRLQAKPFMESLMQWRVCGTELEVENEWITVWVLENLVMG